MFEPISILSTNDNYYFCCYFQLLIGDWGANGSTSDQREWAGPYISCWIIQQTHRSVVFQSNKCLLWNLKPIEIRQLVLNGNVSAENWSPIDEAAMYFNYKQLITDWKTIQFSIWCEDRRYQYISAICWIFIQDSILISQIFNCQCETIILHRGQYILVNSQLLAS